MTRLLCAVIVSVALVGTTPELRAQAPEPSRQALSERAVQYYKALEVGEIALAWNFFDPSIKRDYPQEDFVKRLSAAFGSIKMRGEPEVSVGRRGNIPIGTVQTRLVFQSREGKPLPDAIHYTTWVWQQPGPREAPSWFLLGGPMRTQDEGQGVQPPSMTMH